MPRAPKQKVWFEKVSWSKLPLVMRKKLGLYFDIDATDARLIEELRIRRK